MGSSARAALFFARVGYATKTCSNYLKEEFDRAYWHRPHDPQGPTHQGPTSTLAKVEAHHARDPSLAPRPLRLS
jgi:hypothetical protein